MNLIERYTAVGLQTTFLNVQSKDDYKKNLKHIGEVFDAAMYLCRLEFPVKLVAIPEAAIQTFVDSRLQYDHVRAARELMTTIPGPETEFLAQKAKEYDTYVIAQLRVVEPDIIPDRYFNVAFIINPKGEIILKHYKLQVYVIEQSLVPHDIWDRWVEKFGYNLDAFYQVARTEIGNLGCLICMEGSYPETARGLAMNGAEVIYRPTYNEPYVGADWFEIQNRARALDNSCYVISPNSGEWYMNPDSTVPIDIHGGRSIIVDYRGQVISRKENASSGFVSAVIDIAALRDYRERALWGNWLKDLRTEQYKLIYEEPIYPKNNYLTEEPKKYPERVKIYENVVKTLQQRGVWVAPNRGSANGASPDDAGRSTAEFKFGQEDGRAVVPGQEQAER